jgi:tetratricopeptide (TPR) repeat protein
MPAPSYRFLSLLTAGLLSLSSVGHAQSNSTPATRAAELDAGAAFERARIYYESAKYAACVDAFTRLLDKSDHLGIKERAAARTYLAACLIASGKMEDARQQFRQAILEDRQLEPPDPVVFPPAVVDVFVQVRSTLMDALRRQQEEDLQRSRREAAAQRERAQRERVRVRELERLASLETLVRKNERWMAWVPFGLGQFHNDSDTLGWIFLSAEATLAVTAITATSIELGLHSKAEGGRAPLDSRDLTNKVRVARDVGTAAWLSLIGVAAAGILEANISYRGELPAGQRRRALPESLRSGESARGGRVEVAPLIGAGWVGVKGSF